MRRFVAVDIETTGLNPQIHEVIEVGLVIEPVYGGPVEYREFSLDFDPTCADAEALKVNGWGTRQFAPVVDAKWAAGFLLEATKDAHLVGKNPHFDAAFLAQFLFDHDCAPAWHHRLVDVGCLAWGWFNGQCEEKDYMHPQPPNVGQVEKLIGVRLTEDERHTALGDARWAYRAFRHCVPDLSRRESL